MMVQQKYAYSLFTSIAIEKVKIEKSGPIGCQLSALDTRLTAGPDVRTAPTREPYVANDRPAVGDPRLIGPGRYCGECRKAVYVRKEEVIGPDLSNTQFMVGCGQGAFRPAMARLQAWPYFMRRHTDAATF
jgi:hypothetical protein